MSIVDVLTRNLNRIQISKTEDPLTGQQLYCLWDHQESCVLDQWRVHSAEDFDKMKADLMQIYKGGPHEDASA